MNYHDEIKIQNTLKLRELNQKLPNFCSMFFRGIENNSSSRTRIGYAYDLLIWFDYYIKHISSDSNLKIKDITLQMLDNVNKIDIENYLEYLSYYVSSEGVTHTNDERGKARKLSALKGLYTYLQDAELIKNNPAIIVHSPKLHDKTIIRLDPNEVALLLDIVDEGCETDSDHEKAYHNKNRIRDLAMMTLLLGTGIRVSECVGLNLKDVDFDNGAIHIIRKGGNEANVYFGEEVEEALSDYIDLRNKIIPLSGHEDALFLSMQNKRISVRAVEKMVKKYASKVTSLKKITPHKLRSTYGTNLYKESGDIYLVATVLGHKDVNTTRKHYADMDEDLKRNARNMVKLREK